MELEVQWQEHELGSYPTIVLLWKDAMRGKVFGLTHRDSKLRKEQERR
jgi:hypothetical protein